jgi:hypothetical protein
MFYLLSNVLTPIGKKEISGCKEEDMKIQI